MISDHFGKLAIVDAQKIIDILRIIEIEQIKNSDKLDVLDLDSGDFGSYAEILYPWPFRYSEVILASAVAGICRNDTELYEFIVALSNSCSDLVVPVKNVSDIQHWKKIIQCIELRNLINRRNYTEATDVLAGFNAKVNKIFQHAYYLLCKPRGKLNDITLLMELDSDKLRELNTIFS